jgi:hypothetical protein
VSAHHCAWPPVHAMEHRNRRGRGCKEAKTALASLADYSLPTVRVLLGPRMIDLLSIRFTRTKETHMHGIPSIKIFYIIFPNNSSMHIPINPEFW